MLQAEVEVTAQSESSQHVYDNLQFHPTGAMIVYALLKPATRCVSAGYILATATQ